MPREVSVARPSLQVILVLLASAALVSPLHAQDVSAQALFAAAPFEHWQAEGPRQQVPWKIRPLPVRLSLHQRLEAAIEVRIPEAELAKRRDDGRIVLLVQLTDPAGRRYRNSGVLELDDVARKAIK